MQLWIRSGVFFPGPGQSPLFRVGLLSDRLPFENKKNKKKQTHRRDFNALKNKEMSLMMHLRSGTIASGGACGNCRSISVLYEKLKLSDSPNSGIVEYTEYSVLTRISNMRNPSPMEYEVLT